MIADYNGIKPQIDDSCFIAEGTQIIGDVKLEKNVSIWFNAVLRGDMGAVIIGENTNIQDGCVLHCVMDIPTIVGKNVTVGHGAILHSCSIGDGTLIGMGAIILDGVQIGKNSIVAAGSIIPPYSVIGDGALVMGAPAKIKRALTEDDIKNIKKGISEYLELVKNYNL